MPIRTRVGRSELTGANGGWTKLGVSEIGVDDGLIGRKGEVRREEKRKRERKEKKLFGLVRFSKFDFILLSDFDLVL